MLTAEIISELTKAGGVVTAEDLAQYQAEEGDGVIHDYGEPVNCAAGQVQLGLPMTSWRGCLDVLAGSFQLLFYRTMRHDV